MGSFHEEEAKERLARGKKLTKEWRKTMIGSKPTNEWVIQELERLGVRTVTGRGRWNKRRRGGVEESSVDVGGREDASSEEEVEEESDDNFSGGEEDSVAGRGANDSDYVESGNDVSSECLLWYVIDTLFFFYEPYLTTFTLSFNCGTPGSFVSTENCSQAIGLCKRSK